MASINPTISRDVSASGSVIVVTWVLPTTGDVGVPFRLDRFSLSSFNVFGTAVTSLGLQGCNDPDTPSGTSWNALRDWGGASLAAVAAAGIYTPRDLPIWIRPALTTGTAVTIQMALHRADIGVTG
jgi:hypothetical protein